MSRASRFPNGFDELRVGDAYESPWREITAQAIDAFAELTGDRHPQHTRAGGSLADGQIAHGLLVVGFAAGLMQADAPAVSAVRRLSEIVFRRPVRPGERIAVRAAIERLVPIAVGHGLVTIRLRAINEREQLVFRGALDVVWERRGPEATAPAR